MTSPENRIHIEGFGPADIALLKTVAVEASEQTMRRWFTMMGLDPEQPIEMQRAFVILRETVSDPEFRADQSWTRRTRKRTEGFIGKAFVTVLGVAMLGAAQTLWAGLKSIAQH
jgi:hypothetical protein